MKKLISLFKTHTVKSLLCLGVILCLAGGGICVPAILSQQNKAKNKDNAFDSTDYDTSTTTVIDEIWNDNGYFKPAAFNQLLSAISGGSANYNDISSLETDATATKTAEDLRTNNGGKEIIVRMGGIDWTPTYLSKDNQGNTILTLWMTNSDQDAFKDLPENAGPYHGFVYSSTTQKTGLYSDWAADWAVYKTSYSYPSAMYGTSYIRAVTLNNGGDYALSGGETLQNAQQDENSVFAKFTMITDDNKLPTYIVEPANVEWQYYQNAKTQLSTSYLYPNEGYQANQDNTGYYSGYNYSTKEKYDTWKDDKLWLPSLTETGYSDTKTGIWNTSTEQRKNYNGSPFSSSFTASAKIGTDNTKGSPTTAYTYSWLRSGDYNTASNACNLLPSADNTIYVNGYCSQAVRPALHLSLNSAALSAASAPPPSWLDYAEANFENGSEVDGSTEAAAFEISNAAQLALLAKRVSAGENFSGSYFKLTKDIFFAPHPWSPIGTSSTAFAGNFDGQGHTIYGLNIDTDQDNQGLFGYVSGGSIKNLNLKSGIIKTTGSVVGSLVGLSENEIIENVSSNVEVYGNYTVGGLVGSLSEGQIFMCTYSGYVFGTSNVGGIAATNSGTITNCTVNCYVSATETVGALAGLNFNGSISNCVAKGTVDGPGKILVGDNDGIVKVDYFYGSATSDSLTLDPTYMTACWAVVNDRKLCTSASMEGDDLVLEDVWSENWVVVPELNNGLPMQKGLFWVGDDVMTSADKIKEALNGFVPVN